MKITAHSLALKFQLEPACRQALLKGQLVRKTKVVFSVYCRYKERNSCLHLGSSDCFFL